MTLLKLISLYSGAGLMVLGIVNTLLMFEMLGRRGAPASLRTLHRWLGRIFVLMTVALFIYMTPRLAHINQFTPHATFHAVLGLTLVIMSIWKVLIVWRYKAYMGVMPAFGFTLMVVAFVALMLTSGHMIAEGLTPEHVNH